MGHYGSIFNLRRSCDRPGRFSGVADGRNEVIEIAAIRGQRQAAVLVANHTETTVIVYHERNRQL